MKREMDRRTLRALFLLVRAALASAGGSMPPALFTGSGFLPIAAMDLLPGAAFFRL